SHPQKEDQGYVDSGSSRHMTGNMSYLSDFKEFDRGYVTFGRGAKGGRITGKGTLKTGKLDFEDVYFVKDLKFNLLSVSQMCDKKNNVLFTDIGCYVLSLDFKLTDESQVYLKSLEGIISSTPKLTVSHPQKEDQGYVDSGSSRHMTGNMSYLSDFKEFDRGYVTFGRGAKEGRITGKGTLKTATKDETTSILKRFITEIENIVDKKVKVIRCDNGTVFKNSVMNDFCAMKGIRREFSVARTPQQNGVAERRNRTLIQAARTMLADSKGRTPALSFMRPFGCHVTILKTLDHLGKFDGKSDDGFFVGYLLNSKAFRVYNLRTIKVEENLHIRFLEDKPSIAGNGLKWLFDIDVLTKLMNYVPVVAGTNSNDFVDGSLFDSSLKNASNDEPQPSSDAVHKDDEGSGVLTMRTTKTTNDQGFISAVYEGKTHEYLHTCLFACFLSQEEPKKVIQALKDLSWI
nr:hypothetical protein [Tanacetum cinerariifolium]